MSWRIPFIIQVAQSTILAAFCIFLPSSPRWLILHGRRPQALKAINRLNISSVEAEKDILNAQHEQTSSPSKSDGFLMIFHRQYRARTVLALFILGMVQLCGIDGVLYVSFLSTIRPVTTINNVNSMPRLSSPKPVSPRKRPPFSHQASPRFSCSPSPSLPSTTRTAWGAAHPPS